MKTITLLIASALLLPAVFVNAAEPARDEVIRTAAAHAGDRPEPAEIVYPEPAVPVNGSTIIYTAIDGEPVNGYLARPAATGEQLPALIVIHEWWGLNDNIRRMAERLAGEGYVTLAVDLYRGGLATTPKAAMKLMQGLGADMETAKMNLEAAHDYLASVAGADKVGVIGWCLGGRWSLQAALHMPEKIDAMVMYYGSVVTDESKLATLDMPILGNFAEDDPIIPLDEVNAFRDTLKKLGKDVDVKIYDDAKHAFSNPSGLAYNKAAADDAWRRSTGFLAEHLQ